MAKNIPGVVRVQRNSATQTYHLTIPKHVREDIPLEPQDFVLFYKEHEHDDTWQIRKISSQEKEQIRQAHRNNADIMNRLN